MLPKSPRQFRSVPRPFAASALASRKLGGRALSMTSSVPAPPKFWTAAKNSGSSPWYAPTRQKDVPAGRSGWWPKKLSSGSWCHGSEERPSGFCCSTTNASRGGKRMWCVADLDDDYIDKGRTFWKPRSGPRIRHHRWSVWMRNRSRCTPTCDRFHRPNRDGKRDGTTNMRAAERPMFSAP